MQSEVKRIDAALEAPPSGRLQRVRKNLPHWEFLRMFDRSMPVWLSARFSEGQVVREEAYYLRGGKLAFVRVERWWDIDGTNRVPEPKALHDLYIENSQTIRHVFEVASSSPASTTK